VRGSAGDGTENGPAAEDAGGTDEPRVLVSVEDGIGRLTLNRPEKLNVVVVTGRGRAFAAGADVSYLSELIEGQRLEEARALVDAGRRVVTAVVEMPKPVIAALNGPAAGGGANLALACDIRIAAEGASIGQTFNRIGLHPDWGGTYFLPRLVGPAKAAELIFTGEMVGAREAERIGMVNRVVPDEELRAEVEELAGRLAEKPALPLRLAKRAVRRSLDSSLDEMLDYELEAQTRCFESPDAREGVRAFLEKRDPEFER